MLVKFKLLEQQRMMQGELARWMAQAPLMVRIRDRFMPGQDMAEISAQTVRALVGAGALAVEEEWVVNRD
ncbi:hypothetical protein D9M69_625030 [compost metagenome]